jgi:hypothetical protein
MADTTQMNMKRMRGRGQNRHGGGGGGGGGGGHFRHAGGGGGGGGGHQPMNRNHVFDSTGPDLRLRGTAQQLFEKYLQLGRDATSGGDRVMAEGYFQHAEHYFRILNAMNQAQQQQQAPQQQGGRRYPDQPGPASDSGVMDLGGEQPELSAQASSLEAELEAEVQAIEREPRERDLRDRDLRERDREPRDRDQRERDYRDRDTDSRDRDRD